MQVAHYAYLLLAGCLVGAGGCGTVDTRLSVEQLTNARIAVEAAEKADAKTYAPENLRRAQDALAIAKDAYANQAFPRAFDFAKKATIFARVAKARTEQKQAEGKLAELKEQYNSVRARTESMMQSSSPATAGPQGHSGASPVVPLLETEPLPAAPAESGSTTAGASAEPGPGASTTPVEGVQP